MPEGNNGERMPKSDTGGSHSGDDPTLDRDTHWRQVAQRHYEPDGDGDLTTAIVFTIADAKNVSPAEMKPPPLYESVDVAAIDDAFFGLNREDAARQGTGTIKFRYTEYLVKIRSDGWIQVYAPTETALS